MGYDDRREIFERLERLERLARDRHDDRGRRDDDRRHGRDRGRHRHDDRRRDRDDEFDEKRVIDTIVHCVSDHVGRMLDEHESRQGRRNGGGGDEKRIVDLIVGLVSEHVEEIVRTELDRRLGRADAPRNGDEPAPPATDDEPEPR